MKSDNFDIYVHVISLSVSSGRKNRILIRPDGGSLGPQIFLFYIKKQV